MTDITLFKDTALPAHIAAAFTPTANDDLSAGVGLSYPIISYKGKSWHIVSGGVSNLVKRSDGDPAASLEVIILKANPAISKVFYKDRFVEGTTEKPDCYSVDSMAPALDATEPQAKKCALCKWNQFGSRISDEGAKGKACSDSRRLAVAPGGNPENAMLLRVPAASLKELSIFADMLKQRQVPYQALVTKIGFDHDVAYPKLTFTPVRWLNADEVAKVQALGEGELVRSITTIGSPSVDENPAGAGGPGMDPLAALGERPTEAEAPATATTAKAAAKAAKPKATPVASAEEVAAAVEPKAEPAAEATMGFGGEGVTTAETPATKGEVLVANATASLDDILAGLGQDD